MHLKILFKKNHIYVKHKGISREMTRLIHGEDSLQQAIKITEALFSGDVRSLSASEIEQGFKDVPSFNAADTDGNLVDLLVAAKISPSKRQAREDITNGAVTVNGERITDTSYELQDSDRIEGQFTIIRRGKKKYTLIRY